MNQDRWWSFQAALVQSIVHIPSEYITIIRHKASPRMRERAYCYELYHQLRCRYDSVLTLHGEIDKRGQYPDRPNPDLVLHLPGTNTNLAVIEVKCSSDHHKLQKGEARKDIEKLLRFTQQAPSYQHGIFLVCGPVLPRGADKRSYWAGMIQNSQKIDVLWHKTVGEKPTILFSADDTAWLKSRASRSCLHDHV